MAYEEIVQQYYVGFYGRPADEEGLEFWTNQLEDAGGDFSAIQDSFANSQEYRDFVLIDQGAARSYEDLVNFIYNNLFGRDAEPEGLEFYVSRLESGEYSLIDIVKRIIDGAQNGDLEAFNNKVEVADYFTAQLDGTPYTRDDILDARDLLAHVTDDPGSVTEGFAAADALFAEQASQIFTLKEVWVDGEPEVLPVTEVYWGYPMCSDCQDGPEGIPLDELVAFVTTITGLDLEELGLIDDDGSGPFDNVTSLTLSNPLSSETIGDATSGEVDVDDGLGAGAGNVQLTIQYVDGTVMSFDAEPLLGEQYFNFLTNLLFYETDEGQLKSRLFEKVVVDGVEATEDYMVPIVLTTNQNNGGTYEPGWTSFGNDTIVVGRLELLHGAYIDAGGGYDILEVDAKGTFAQPLQLLNIEEIRVQNLNNAYTVRQDDGNTYPDLPDNNSGNSLANSILDLSRATSLERLVITEGDYQGADQDGDKDAVGVQLGELTIVGIRNGATAVLEGGFTQDVTLHYGQGLTGPLTVELDLGLTNANLNMLHNSDDLILISRGENGESNTFGSGSIELGNLTNLYIRGDAFLGINGDLDDSFKDNVPVLIDASENTGGVSLELSGSQNVTFKGSTGSDRFVVTTADRDGGPTNDETVDIIDTAGDNYYEVHGAEIVTIVDGDGNSNYEIDNASGQFGYRLPAVNLVTITTGDGDNRFELENVAEAVLTAGDGDNRFDIVSGNSADYSGPDDTIDYPSSVTIAVGDGDNIIDLEVDAYIGTAYITAGAGDNSVDVMGHSVDVTTGAGTDDIKVLADEIRVDSGGGGDTITVSGWDYDFIGQDELGGNGSNPGSGGAAAWGDDGVLLQIDTGAGASTVILGSDKDYQWEADNDFPGVGSLTAIDTIKGDSYITGEDITLFVKTVADLRAADLDGITRVVLDDDAFDMSDMPLANEAIGGINAAVLTLTVDQFMEIGAENFSVEGAVFNTHAFVKIIVDEDISLTEMGVDDLPRNIDLLLEVQDGVTLTMTAEQLHTKVAQKGITLANDGNTDYGNGDVVITGGGNDFDPFNTSDTIKTVINGNTYYGGSISEDFWFDRDDDGQIDWPIPNEYFNVDVQSIYGGYERPKDYESIVTYTINADDNPIVEEPISIWHNLLVIIGSQEIEFAAGPIQLGMVLGEPTNPFTIDFSELEGEVINFTVDNFEMLAQGGEIIGNADNGYPSEVLIHIAADDVGGSSNGFGWDEPDAESLVSAGVERYIVTQIDGPTAAGSLGSKATIVLCDTAQDIEVFGLRGNYNDALVIVNAAWGLAFELQGGSTAKADGPTGTANVGALYVDYAWKGADAVVDLVHSVEGDVRPIYAAGIDIDNADSITINAEGPAAIIKYIAGDSAETLDVNADGDVIFDLDTDLPTSLTMIDASGVVGTFTASIDGNPTGDPDDYMDGAFTFVGAQGGSFLTLDDLPPTGDDAPAYVIDGGVGGVELTIDGGPTGVDLSEATLTNITGVVLKDDARLTIQMEDADLIGAENFSLAEGAEGATLNLVGLSDQPFALADYPEGFDVTITLADDPVVTLHPDTDLTGISELIVPEGTILELTAEQFQQLEGDGTITGLGSVHITDMYQVDVGEAGEDLDLDHVDVEGTITISLAESVDLSDADIYSDWNEEPRVDTFNIGTFTLTLGEIHDADGVAVLGDADSTLEFTDTSEPILSQIDASGFDVDYLKVLNVLVANNNVDYMFDGLPERVTKIIYDDYGYVEGRTQYVVIEEGVTVPGDISFNDYGLDTEVLTLNVTFEGGTLLDGDLIVSTVTKGEPGENMIPLYLQELNIVSAGSEETTNIVTGKTENIITGDITPLAFLPWWGDSRDNNLKLVNITADNDLIIEGAVIFNSHGEDDDWKPDDGITANDDTDAVVTLNIEGEADVTIGQINVEDADIGTLIINHTGTGTLYVTGTSPAIEADDTDAIYFQGTGDIVLGSEDNDYWGIDSWENDDEALSLIDATEYSGTLTMGVITDINDDDFTFYAGPGVVTATIADSELEADWPSEAAASGWNFDFSDAAEGSSLTFGAGTPFDDIDWTVGELNIDMGANAVLYIMEDTDWTGIDLTYAGTQAIVLGDEVELIMTAEQASGLNIIAGEDTGDAGFEGVVNIVDLGDDPVDLSGIAEEIAGVVTLEDDDVTLDVATDLGFFTVQLVDIYGTDASLAGQTIRFQTVAQAERDIRVGPNFYGEGDTDIDSSTNVVWLFTDIDAPVDTSGYDPEIGRLWLMDALIDGEGGDVENLFTTLPYSIIRAEFEDPSFLDVLLSSQGVDRIFEAVSFMQLGDLTFSDVGIDPQEHVASLEMRLGGQVTIGSIILDDEVTDPLFDPELVEFSTLTIVSYRALSDEHFMAAEEYVNDNDGTNEPGEHVLPANLNTVGDIYIGTANGIDLLDVRLDTLGDSTVYEGSGDTDMELWGANLETGTITYDSEEPGSFATLTVSGENDIDIASVNTDDADILAVNVVYDGFTGTLTAPGTSPAFQVNATEALTFANASGDTDVSVTTLGSEENAGVVGDELSLIDASGYYGDLDLGIIALVDGTDDEAFDYNGDGIINDPLNPDDDYEGANIAFTLIGNNDTGGTTWATLGAANGFFPTLETGSTWRFEDVNLTITEDVGFEAGAVLQLDAVALIIEGEVDLSEVDLTVSGASTIWVPEESNLILSVEQVLDLKTGNYEITGSGTVSLVGDATDDSPSGNADVMAGYLADVLKTVNVDASEVTIDTTSDNLGGFFLRLKGALDDDGEDAGHSVLGSGFNDLIEIFGPMPYGNIISGGDGGNDILWGGVAYGSDTFIVVEGTDIIPGLYGDAPDTDPVEQDVLQVHDGATAYALIGYAGLPRVLSDFIATDETFNDGTAILIGEGTTTIDVSMATGSEGFTLIGGSSYSTPPILYNSDYFDDWLDFVEELAEGHGGDGNNTLIGSANADIINGGNDEYLGDRDILTGNGGNDIFKFNVTISDPAELIIGDTTQEAEDHEWWEVVSDNTDTTTVAVNYQLNETLSTTVNVDITGLTDKADVALAIANRLDIINGISAEVGTEAGEEAFIIIQADDGNLFEINFINNVDGTGPTYGELTEGDDLDVEQISLLEVASAPSEAGETYNLTVRLADGQLIIADEYEATGSESQVQLRDALITSFNNNAGDLIKATAGTGDGDIILTSDPDHYEGGFTVTNFSASGAFSGSGASGDPDPAGVDGNLESADIITDFNQNGDDVISLGLEPGIGGSGGNYYFAAQQDSYSDAYDLANSELDGDVIYFFTSIEADATYAGTADEVTEGDTVGLLFFDANNDGEADGVLALIGVDETMFGAGDIIA